MKYCEQCGTCASDNARFCSACGMPLKFDPETHRVYVCKNCGEAIQDGDKFCANCGKSCEEHNSNKKNDVGHIDEPDTSSNGRAGLSALGILLMFICGALIVYGSNLNNSFEAQLNSLFSSGAVDPGTTWITIGALGVILGLVLLAFGLSKNNNN